MDKKTIDILLKKSYRSFSEKINPKIIKKIIPIAFPVLQSTWRARIAISESSGLIDRYILRALKDFGPCDIKRLDELLCLGEERIEHAINEMERFGSPIVRTANMFSFAPDGDIESFRIIQEHDFTFCINGLSGDLLPIDFCKKSKQTEINNIEEEYTLYIKMLPITSGAESKLATLCSGTDSQKAGEGIPDGFVDLMDKTPRNESCRYFLAFAVLTIDGTITVFGASNAVIILNSINNYLEQIPEIKQLLKKTDTIDIHSTGLILKQDKTIVYVKVQNHDLWNCFATDDSTDPAIFLMRDFIKNGWLWDISSKKFSHYILLPEDEATAKALFVCRASFELEHCYSNIDTRHDAEIWLHELYERFNNRMIACPDLDDVLAPLLKSPNSEVRDFVKMISATNQKKVVNHEFDKIFFMSTEKDWTSCVTVWLKRAKASIQIITPVIESELIFNELYQANKRGVYLQIITSLLDRNGNIKAAGDKQFSSLRIPGQKLATLGASVRATKNIPHIKIIIIDESVVLFMSANLNDNSLGFGKENAVEMCIILHEPSIVSSCVQLFSGVWECAQFIQGTDKKSAFLAQRAGKSLSELPNVLNGKNESLVFSCPQNLSLENTIVRMIKEAKTEVILMAMSFYDMDQVPSLYKTIQDLLSKKVSVKLLVRTGAEQFPEEKWPDESTILLLNAGMELIEVPHLHAKGVIVDDKAALAMSANFNPFSLGNTATSHIECGLLATGEASWTRQFISFTKSMTN